MATVAERHGLVQKLHMNLTCQLCSCKMVLPSLLPCGHSVCWNCLKQAADHRTVACFSCSTNAGDLDFDKVVANFSLNLMTTTWNPDRPNPQALLSITRCRDCKKWLERPVTLPCGHSTCRTCARWNYGATMTSTCIYCGENFGEEEICLLNYNLDTSIQCCLALLSSQDSDAAPHRLPPVEPIHQPRHNPWIPKVRVKTEPVVIPSDDEAEAAGPSTTVPVVERVSTGVQTSPPHVPSPTSSAGAPGRGTGGSGSGSGSGSTVPSPLDLSGDKHRRRDERSPGTAAAVVAIHAATPPSETERSPPSAKPAFTHGVDLSGAGRPSSCSPFEFITDRDEFGLIGPGPSPGERLIVSSSESLIFSNSETEEGEEAAATATAATAAPKAKTKASRRRKAPASRKKKAPPPARVDEPASTVIPARSEFEEEDVEVAQAFEGDRAAAAAGPPPIPTSIPRESLVSPAFKPDTLDLAVAPTQNYLAMRNFGRIEMAKDVYLSVREIVSRTRHAIKTIVEDGLPPEDPNVDVLNYGIYAEGCDVFIVSDSEEEEEEEEAAVAAAAEGRKGERRRR